MQVFDVYEYTNQQGRRLKFFMEWSEAPYLIASINGIDDHWYKLQISAYIHSVSTNKRGNVQIITYSNKEDYFYIFNRYCV